MGVLWAYKTGRVFQVTESRVFVQPGVLQAATEPVISVEYQEES
jgi:hypothetical protein